MTPTVVELSMEKDRFCGGAMGARHEGKCKIITLVHSYYASCNPPLNLSLTLQIDQSEMLFAKVILWLAYS